MTWIRALALVSTTCEWSRLPLGPIVATVQLDEWAPSPIYLSTGVLLVPLIRMIEKVGTKEGDDD